MTGDRMTKVKEAIITLGVNVAIFLPAVVIVIWLSEYFTSGQVSLLGKLAFTSMLIYILYAVFFVWLDKATRK